MRIAMAGFAIESSTFTPLLTPGSAFFVFRGEELRKSYAFLEKYPGIEFIPILRARSLPGGAVEKPFFEAIKVEMLESLRANGPYDGLFLHMHGAANASGMEDLEGDLVAGIRSVVGEDCLISASYDLHGNLSQRGFEHLDLITAYRKAPHTDAMETVERAMDLLVHCLTENIRPHKAYIRVPILLPGEQTSTQWEPAASLYAGIPGVIQPQAVLDASILIGYLWADEPRSAASVVAYGTEAVAVRRAAQTLAQNFWDVRHEFRFGVQAGPMDECIRTALEAPVQPVVISDSGDNPTAGGAGDMVYALERLLANHVPDAVFASVADGAAAAVCHAAGVGGQVELSLGGKLDPVNGKPLTVKGQVLSLQTQPWPLYGATKAHKTNRMALVQIEGVQVIVTEQRTPFHRIADFEALGIDPHQHKIVVVKIGYLEPELEKLAAKALLALTPGGVNQDIQGLPFKWIERPIFPLDVNMEWEPSLK